MLQIYNTNALCAHASPKVYSDKSLERSEGFGHSRSMRIVLPDYCLDAVGCTGFDTATLVAHSIWFILQIYLS